MKRQIELKFKCEDEAIMEKIYKDMTDYFKIEEVPTIEYRDYYFLSTADKHYRLRHNITKDKYTASKRINLTEINEQEGFLVRNEEQAPVELEKISDAEENYLIINKKRKEFRIDNNIKIGFDEVEGLGCFVEVEGREGDEDKIFHVAHLLDSYNLIPERYSYFTQKLKKELGEIKYYKMFPEYKS